MRTRAFLFAALFAVVPSLVAQDEAKPPTEPAMPNPKHEAHALLAQLAGTWQTNCKMAAMPGVPGMEKPTESTGIEQAELICGGLWLKCTMTGEYQGEVCEGVWLLGYDPFKKGFVGLWVSNMEETSNVFDGTYDEKARSWNFHGDSFQGPFRSVFALTDANRSVETCFMKGQDGKEVQCVEIVRTRTKSTAPAASKGEAKAPSDAHARLLEGVGDWDALVKSAIPGMPASESKCSERVRAICGGRWTWSDFSGEMMGMPFEGHALCGYEPTSGKYVSYWIDSMSATHMRTTGSYDEKAKIWAFAGNAVDEQGRPMAVSERYTQKDANTRRLEMTFKSEAMSHEMTIDYTRAKRN